MNTTAISRSIEPFRAAKGPPRRGPLTWACVLAILFCTASAWAQCENGVCRPGNCPLGSARPGDSPLGTATHPAVVRVMNSLRGSRYYGTGTLIEKDAQGGIVLTCAHLFPQQGGTVAVTFADGRRLEAKVLAVDAAWDLAALEIPPSEAKPVTIATEHPQPGETLTSCGYGSDGRYWCNQGRALGYVRTASTASYETLELSGSARQGDSGGPVFNQRGELVAVLWGTDGRIVGGTYCGRIRKFLARLFSHWRNQRPQPTPEGTTPPLDLPAPPQERNDGDGLHKRLDELAANFQEMHRRLGGQEQSLGQRIQQAMEMSVSLRGRLDKAEAVVGNDNLRAVVKDVATGVLADQAPTLAAKALPALLAALGWTGPPSMALMVAARIFAVLWKQHRKRKGSATSRKSRSLAGSRLRGDDNAGASAISGRSSLADATLGREYDEELRNAAESGDATLARWARALRDRVAQKFYRIHSQSPMPAEPFSSGRGVT